jgi:curved DNA-binding protein CbpA
VKKAFRGLALRNHPDKGGSVEAIQKINNANDVIAAAMGW